MSHYENRGETKKDDVEDRFEETPTRFWRWFYENEFNISSSSGEGNFGIIVSAQLKDDKYGIGALALKYPKESSTWERVSFCFSAYNWSQLI